MRFPSIIFALLLHSILIPCVFSNSGLRLKLFTECIEVSGLPSDRIITKNANPDLYNHLNYQWNLRIPHIDPLAYFLPRKTKDVQYAVLCGSKVNVPLIPKSGGHSYESYGFGSSNTIIIDFIKMDNISVDRIGKTAKIQPGALVGQIDGKLWNSGKLGLAMGNCLKVGIAGLVLGGGFGWYSHYFGLTLDSLLELEMVDVNGFDQIVNAKKNPDLFWALRGVGSGYIGIVTSFKFKLFKASKINIRQVMLQYELKDTGQVVQSWQRWIRWAESNAPTVLSQILFSGRSTSEFSHAGAEIRVSFVEVRETKNPEPVVYDIIYKTIIQTFPSSPKNMTVYNADSYMDFVLETGYAPTLSNKTTRQLDLNNLRAETTTPAYVKQKTFFVSKSTFDGNSLNKVAAVIEKVPDRYAWVWFVTGGGAVKEVESTATSYVHRNPPYSVVIRYEGEDTPSEVEVGLKWIQDFTKVSKFMDNGQTYQNYVDGDLKDFQKRYYGKNLERLIQSKRQWDPTNYFQNPQSLPTI